jgi:hypothetical protein
MEFNSLSFKVDLIGHFQWAGGLNSLGSHCKLQLELVNRD